ncbi:MAG: DUF6351 family protein [Longimicrobiales bacterium]
MKHGLTAQDRIVDRIPICSGSFLDRLDGRVAVAGFLAGALLGACGGGEYGAAGGSTEGAVDSAPGPSEIRVVPLSTRSHLVTGGDVLLAIEAGSDVDLSGLTVESNGADVTDRFRRVEQRPLEPTPPGSAVGDRGRLVGLVEGLAPGANEVVAGAPGADEDAALALTSYPVSGPVFSGPHEEPFICQTEDFELAAGGTLGPPLGDDCAVDTRVDYVYLSSTDGEFRPYPGQSSEGTVPGDADVPTDAATARTLHGREVPFIVRVETGTVNRAVYEIAMLHDPAEPAPDPWAASPGWNGKLVYTHGGGCRSGWYQQGDRTGGVLREGLLDMGYAVASASLNVFGQNCNDLLASETHIMVKERFVEAYGPPRYTIGTGGSGGSYQSHQTADNYPGVFDGIIVSSSFPDVTSATIFTLADSRLLHHYFSATAPDALSREQERAVSGFGVWESIPNLSRGAARLDPTYEPEDPPEEQGGELSLPALEERRYDPAGNPDGVRATVHDHTVNVYGVAAEPGPAGTPVAARPLDNRGVQYGLAALEDGTISVRQFLDLNRDIGGFDADLNHVPERHGAGRVAAERALGTGRILHGGGGLAHTPIIDYRSYTDHREGGDIHMIVHQFSTRARLQEANGHSDNHVMAVGGCWGFTEECPDLGVLFRQMDRWLVAAFQDTTAAPLAEKVVENRPAGLVDHCWDTTRETRIRVDEPQRFDGTGRCSELYPAYPTPRHVAGAPLENDVVACRLKPTARDEYSVTFTDEEWAELRDVFPDGVCDWEAEDRYGSGYRGTWLSFGPSPVNFVEE